MSARRLTRLTGGTRGRPAGCKLRAGDRLREVGRVNRYQDRAIPSTGTWRRGTRHETRALITAQDVRHAGREHMERYGSVRVFRASRENHKLRPNPRAVTQGSAREVMASPTPLPSLPCCSHVPRRVVRAAVGPASARRERGSTRSLSDRGASDGDGFPSTFAAGTSRWSAGT